MWHRAPNFIFSVFINVLLKDVEEAGPEPEISSGKGREECCLLMIF